MSVKLWSSMPITSGTSFSSSNNKLDVVYNGTSYNLVVSEGIGYSLHLGRKESILVDVINELLQTNSINVKCLVGVQAYGIEKEAYIVFERNNNDTLTVGGSITNVIGKVS